MNCIFWGTVQISTKQEVYLLYNAMLSILQSPPHNLRPRMFLLITPQCHHQAQYAIRTAQEFWFQNWYSKWIFTMLKFQFFNDFPLFWPHLTKFFWWNLSYIFAWTYVCLLEGWHAQKIGDSVVNLHVWGSKNSAF